MAESEFYTAVTVLQKLAMETSYISDRLQDVPPNNLQGSPFPTHPDRLVKILDAFASICVHKKKNQVVAVSASLTSDQPKLFISQNDVVALKVKPYLEKVWGLLHEIAESLTPVDNPDSTKSSPNRVPKDVYITDRLEAKLRALVYEFGYPKQLSRMNKELDKLKSFLQWLSDFEKGSTKLRVFIGNVVRLCEKKPNDKIKYEIVSEGFRGFALFIGKGFDKPDSEYNDLEAEYNADKNSDNKFMLCHRLSKLLSLNNHLLSLLLFARSSRLGPYLRQKPLIDLIPPCRLAPIEINLTEEAVSNCIDKSLSQTHPPYSPEVLTEIKTELLKELEGKYEQRIAHLDVHAELNLLLFHLRSPTIHCYNYFGVSKLCCFPCEATFRTYRNLSRPADHLNFYTSGTRGKVYPKWALPPVFTDKTSQDLLCDLVRKAVEAEIVRIGQHIRQRAGSDSTAAFGGSDISMAGEGPQRYEQWESGDF